MVRVVRRSLVLASTVLLLGAPGSACGETTGPPHFVLQSTQGVDPCLFRDQFWNGGSGTDVEWVLPARLSPISSCSFTATFKNTGGGGAGHVMFTARYGPESVDPQGYWHVRFIEGATITCSRDLPPTQPAAVSAVKCSLSAPDSGQFMGDYTYGFSN